MHKQDMDIYVTTIETENILAHKAQLSCLSYTRLTLIIAEGKLVALVTTVSPVMVAMTAMMTVVMAFRRRWDNDCLR